jgi:hypothetical protein
MSTRRQLRRLERLAEGETVVIPQLDGSVKRFPEYELREAYLNFFARLGAGEGAPPEHALCRAARNSSDPWWRDSIYAADEDITAPIEDLSEP